MGYSQKDTTDYYFVVMDEIKVPMAKPVLGDDELNGIMKVVNSGWLGQGKVTEEFESKFADKIKSNLENISTVDCCTEGLFQIIELMNLEEGLEQIAEEWGRWKSGPATEKYDIKPARKEVLNFCVAWLKKSIK